MEAQLLHMQATLDTLRRDMYDVQAATGEWQGGYEEELGGIKFGGRDGRINTGTRRLIEYARSTRRVPR